MNPTNTVPPIVTCKQPTVGVRIPEHRTTLDLLDLLGEPLMSSTLILPGQTEPMTEGWIINDELGNQVDAVLDSGDVGSEPTTVVNFVDDEVRVDRVGAGDPTPFE